MLWRHRNTVLYENNQSTQDIFHAELLNLSIQLLYSRQPQFSLILPSYFTTPSADLLQRPTWDIGNEQWLRLASNFSNFASYISRFTTIHGLVPRKVVGFTPMQRQYTLVQYILTEGYDDFCSNFFKVDKLLQRHVYGYTIVRRQMN